MLKKLFVTAAAAAAVAVPLVGVAGADPAPDNPGVPGNIPGPTPGQSTSPGSLIKGAAQVPDSNVPDLVGPPGQTIKTFTPGHVRKTPTQTPTPTPTPTEVPPSDGSGGPGPVPR